VAALYCVTWELTGTPRWGGLVHASVIRLPILTIWLVIVGCTPYTAYTAFSPAIASRYGIGHVVFASEQVRTLLLSSTVLFMLKSLALTGILFGMISTRASTVVMPLILSTVIALDTVSKSIGGFANHAQVVPLIALGVMVAFCRRPYLSAVDLVRFWDSSGGVTRADCSSHVHGGVVSTIALVIIMPHMFIGIERLLVGGLDMFTGDVLIQYLSAASMSFQAYPDVVFSSLSGPLLNCGFFMTTLLEVSSPVLLYSRAFRRFWLLGLLAFQIATLVLMNIFFWENLLLSTVVFWGGGIGSRRYRELRTRHLPMRHDGWQVAERLH
jgi:hypothetical protein